MPCGLGLSLHKNAVTYSSTICNENRLRSVAYNYLGSLPRTANKKEDSTSVALLGKFCNKHILCCTSAHQYVVHQMKRKSALTIVCSTNTDRKQCYPNIKDDFNVREFFREFLWLFLKVSAIMSFVLLACLKD